MKKPALLFVLLFSLILIKSQAIAFDLGERLTINSSVLSQERQLQVLVPESYYSNPKATYPVIYLMDGDYNFHGISGMLDLLAGKGQLIPDVILVGIADKGTSLYRQYMTPSVYDSKAKASEGRAAEFLRFITEEVQPKINKTYRTADHSTLVGHSMGGLFVLNAMLETPAAFNNYVAISPSVWVAEQGIVAKAKEKIPTAEHQPVTLFLSLGDETRMGQYDFINVLDVNQPSLIDWQFRHYPDESHNSVGIIALRDSLKLLFKDWYVVEKKLNTFETPDALVKHYQEVMAKFNFSQPMPSTSVQQLFRHHYRQKQVDKLPDFIERTSQKLPASKQALVAMHAKYVGHFESPKAALALLTSVEDEFSQSMAHIKAIADNYEQLKNTKMARKYYQKAQLLAKEQNVNQWQINIIEAKLRLLKEE